MTQENQTDWPDRPLRAIRVTDEFPPGAKFTLILIDRDTGREFTIEITL